ncbi:TonB-dependent receptor domain-containing protein [Spirosoma utsteinense]|uniref:TonB-dependent receptor domain-containing protein n=1 Tax=Spirosoma utsteinense TaxID=2585773 RepID=UPI00164920FF|nr:TonB-dependent receptor [Spirosoma utsteinense]MBC3787786.1 outer membrane receptor protein involved in Fe transport [Spirosoma utsteinense]
MKLPVTRLIGLFFAVLIPLPSLAQSVVIRGRVQDAMAHQPIPGVTVSVWQADTLLLTGTATGGDGAYQLTTDIGLRPVLRVQSVGYQPVTLRPELTPGQSVVVMPLIELRPGATDLNEVVVKGNQATATLKLDKQIYTTKQFQNAANGTGLDLLQRLPAITVNTEGVIALRGSADFLVLINGKPTTRSPADALAQIPANLIEQVEIMTSASARYDADGKAGVVNIITKQALGSGWSLLANGMVSNVSPARFGGDVNLSYTAKTWMVYAAADYRRFNIAGRREGTVRTLYRDTLTYLPSTGIRDWRDQQYSFRTGGSFTPNARTSVTWGYYWGEKQTDRIANLHYQEFSRSPAGQNLYATAVGEPTRLFYNQNLFSRTGSFQTINADLTRTFSDKSKLTLLGLYEYSVLGGPLRNSDQTEDTQALTLRERADERSPLRATRIQVDYVRPLGKQTRLELGYQWRTVQHDGDFTFERLNLDTGQWHTDPIFADRMNLHQRIHGGYAQWVGTTKTVSYQAGLRAEFTNRTLTHQLGRSPYRYTALNWFPSVQGLWKLSETQSLRLAYSRRIDRPTTKALAPFWNHRHAEAIELGDPNLRPELTNGLDLTYSRAWSRLNLTLTGYANQVADKVFRVNDLYNRIILFRTYTNAGTTVSVGLEGIADLTLRPGWRLYASGNVYNYTIRGTYQGEPIDQQSLNYNLNANTTVDLGKRLRFQWDLSYLSRSVTSQGADSDLLLTNAGLRFVWTNRATLGFQANNLLNTNRQNITTAGLTFYSATTYVKYDRVVQLSLNYRLNDAGKKVKAVKTDYGEKDF